IGFTRLYRGNEPGGLDAIGKAIATARSPNERVTVERDRALAEIAAGLFDDADKTIDELERDAKSADAEMFEKTAPLYRALAEADRGRATEALASLAQAKGPIEES